MTNLNQARAGTTMAVSNDVHILSGADLRRRVEHEYQRGVERGKFEAALGKAGNPRHEERAARAIAKELCSLHFTDGFCEPTHNADCKCNKLAAACIRGMAVVGVTPVWVHDKTGEGTSDLTPAKMVKSE